MEICSHAVPVSIYVVRPGVTASLLWRKDRINED